MFLLLSHEIFSGLQLLLHTFFHGQFIQQVKLFFNANTWHTFLICHQSRHGRFLLILHVSAKMLLSQRGLSHSLFLSSLLSRPNPYLLIFDYGHLIHLPPSSYHHCKSLYVYWFYLSPLISCKHYENKDHVFVL